MEEESLVSKVTRLGVDLIRNPSGLIKYETLARALDLYVQLNTASAREWKRNEVGMQALDRIQSYVERKRKDYKP